MHYKGRIYQTYAELEQDVFSRQEAMTTCFERGNMEELASLMAENLAMLEYMKSCQAHAEAIFSLHVNIASLVEEFQSSLIKAEVLTLSFYARKTLEEILKEHVVMKDVLEYFPVYKPLKMRQLRCYLGREEAFNVVMRLMGVSIVYYDKKGGMFILPNMVEAFWKLCSKNLYVKF